MANKHNETNSLNDNRYNGWTNYETWAVALWIDNEEGSQAYWRQEAEYATRTAKNSEQVAAGVWTPDEAARFNLADQLKEEITDAAPDLGASVYSDLLQAAMDSVNWHEIAYNLIEGLDE